MSRISTVIRIASAAWLVVVLLALIFGIPYLIDLAAGSSPLQDPVVQMLFLLVASAIPAAFGLAYATYRRRQEEVEEYLEDLR